MERTIGQYILAVGSELVVAQAKEDNLQLLADDIDWFVTQMNKNTSLILEAENIPQEDMAPSSFPDPLLATPAPAAAAVLIPDAPLSAMSSLTATPAPQFLSPSISVLGTPVIHTLPHIADPSATPKAVAMDISLPRSTTEVIPPTPSSHPVIQPMVTDAQMTDDQKACTEEVLLEYRNQEAVALAQLQATRQRNRDAELALQLERAKLRDTEMLVERIQQKTTAPLSHPNSVSLSYVPPSQRSGSEAAVAITQLGSFAPSLLSSIDSQLLPVPSRPNAPLTSVSKILPQTGMTSTSKGKQRVQSQDEIHDFIFPSGQQGFTELKSKLSELQAPLLDTLSIASMENSDLCTLSTAHS